jgi:cytochrome c oxidase assembly factor CtaG
MITVSLGLLAIVYGIGVARVWSTAGFGRGIGYWEAASFALGWLVLAAALVSRLDEWSDTLFAAHMLQHELLMVIAAPLVALGAPITAVAWALPNRMEHGAGQRLVRVLARSAWILPAAAVCVLHAVLLWIWHVPVLYDLALAHETVHAVQHLSFFGSGVLFWWVLAHGRTGRSGYGAAVLYVFATALHSGLLGALLALSPHVWYARYLTGRNMWGLSPIEDQQIAGLIMWIPASVVFSAAGLVFLAGWLRESGRRVEHLGSTRPTTI